MTSTEMRPWVIAHRGASRACPENTAAAFDEALRQGAAGIELDVQLSRDGVPVVYHDRTLAKAGGGRRRVAQLDVRELTALDPGARVDAAFRGQHIPLLEQVLEQYGRRTRLLVEIKTREGSSGTRRHLQLARTVARLIKKMKLEQRALVLSFDAEVLAASVDETPRLRPVLNLRPPRRLNGVLRERLTWLHALSADVRTLSPGFGAEIARAGKPLFVYTCNTPRNVRRALAASATGVMSDRPDWLAACLRRYRATDGA
jgi:glycerophosphoryl diester phosphodiesterase